VAYDINGRGQVVGTANVPGVSSLVFGSRHAFLWQNGVMTDLSAGAPYSSEARAINSAGLSVTTTATALADGARPAVWCTAHIGPETHPAAGLRQTRLHHEESGTHLIAWYFNRYGYTVEQIAAARPVGQR